jgi:hypothetical protein
MASFFGGTDMLGTTGTLDGLSILVALSHYNNYGKG